MRNRTISVILTVFLVVSVASNAAGEQTESALQIYLPREITIESEVPTLGQVAIMRGEEGLLAKAEQVTLGRISAPGQTIIVDRSIVLSRLACSGIPSSEVTLTGAEKMTVTQQHQVISGDEFVEKALTFLKKSSSDASICQWNSTRAPKDLILSGISNDTRSSVSLVGSGTRNQAKVRIAVFSGNKELGVREVTFRLKYNCRKSVAKFDIPSGSVLSPENVKIENVVSNYPEPANWAEPYGFVAKRRLPANTVIQAGMIGTAMPEVVLKRNQNVVIKVDKSGLFITTTGKAMQAGRVGEYIRVQNVESKIIIMAKVNEDGTVEPVF